MGTYANARNTLKFKEVIEVMTNTIQGGGNNVRREEAQVKLYFHVAKGYSTKNYINYKVPK